MKPKITLRKIQQETVITVRPCDGAFIFKREAGLDVYTPTEFDELQKPISDEGVAAMVVMWILTDETVYKEMLQRFTKTLKARKITQ